MPREFLVFRLWGPMASWGSIAVGERRGSWSRPSRSGVLGLVAAALGIERRDATKHNELEAALGFAVRVDDPGRPLRDYHTAQSPSSRRGARWATRRDELDPVNEINTILSERQYYTGMDCVAALWLRVGNTAPSLAELAARLEAPVFTLYLGRKSCPLGMPPCPRIIMAGTPREVFAAYDKHSEEELANGPDLTWGRLTRFREPAREFWIGGEDARELRLPTPYHERTSRRDSVRDRSRWLFGDREEVCITMEGAAREAAP